MNSVESEVNEYVGYVDMMISIILIFLIIISAIIIVLRQNIILISSKDQELINKDLSIQLLDKDLRDKDTMLQTLEKLMKDKESYIQLLLRNKPKRIIIPNKVKDNIFFDSGSAIIREEFYHILTHYTEYLKNMLLLHKYNHIRIEGHTDIVPIYRNCISDNWELGALRAIAVVRYFIKNGIPPKFLSASTFSKYKPINTDISEKAKAKNRRIEIILLKKE